YVSFIIRMYFVFFFSSRRRHTRSKRDWSSDVCSSDLFVRSRRQPCFAGTMTWGRQNTAADGFAQMDYALEHGINFFDTAEMYAVPSDHTSWSTTETIIGQWFAQHGKRNQVILATKVAGPSRQMDHIRGGPQLNRTHITKALEGSLKRLQTDVIDLYQIHWPGRVSNFFGKLYYPLPTEAPL